MHKKLSGGLWPVMLTPFEKNNEVDYKALEQLTEFYIRAGAKGLFANCLSSEMFQLTEDERLKTISTVVKSATRHNIKVVATGTFSHDMHLCAEFIKKVYDTGTAAVVLISNQLAKIEEDNTVFMKNSEKLLRLTGEIPLGLYESPYPYKRLIPAELMQWLGSTGRFYYHKDTSCDPVAIHQKINSLRHTNCSFYNANTATSLSSLEMGAQGLSVIGGNFYPELYVYMLNQFETDADKEALKKLNDQLNLMDAIASQCYPFSAKLFLQFRKIPISSACRISYKNMTQEDYLDLQSLQRIFHSLLEEYNIEAA